MTQTAKNDLKINFSIQIKIIKKIKRLELDIIHSQTEWGVGTFSRFAAVNLEIPLVHTYHTLYEYYTHYIFGSRFVSAGKKIAAAISKFYCEKCNALIVPTRKVEDILYSYGVDQTMNIIPTGLELDKFYRGNYSDEDLEFMRENFGIEKSDFLCVYIGRIAEEKSIDLLIDMFSKIKDENFKFMIVGRGRILDDLKKQAEDLGISDRVIFTGEVPHDKVAAYYQMGDVFLNASISETQGLTFVEAMAAKTPVVARYDLNLEDLLVKNEAGLVYKTEEEFINEKAKILEENKSFKINNGTTFVLSIISIFLSPIPFFGTIVPVVTLAMIANQNIKSEDKQGNRKLTISTILSLISLIISIVLFFVF